MEHRVRRRGVVTVASRLNASARLARGRRRGWGDCYVDAMVYAVLASGWPRLVVAGDDRRAPRPARCPLPRRPDGARVHATASQTPPARPRRAPRAAAGTLASTRSSSPLVASSLAFHPVFVARCVQVDALGCVPGRGDLVTRTADRCTRSAGTSHCGHLPMANPRSAPGSSSPRARSKAAARRVRGPRHQLAQAA